MAKRLVIFEEGVQYYEGTELWILPRDPRLRMRRPAYDDTNLPIPFNRFGFDRLEGLNSVIVKNRTNPVLPYDFSRFNNLSLEVMTSKIDITKNLPKELEVMEIGLDSVVVGDYSTAERLSVKSMTVHASAVIHNPKGFRSFFKFVAVFQASKVCDSTFYLMVVPETTACLQPCAPVFVPTADAEEDSPNRRRTMNFFWPDVGIQLVKSIPRLRAIAIRIAPGMSSFSRFTQTPVARLKALMTQGSHLDMSTFPYLCGNINPEDAFQEFKRPTTTATLIPIPTGVMPIDHIAQYYWDMREDTQG